MKALISATKVACATQFHYFGTSSRYAIELFFVCRSTSEGFYELSWEPISQIQVNYTIALLSEHVQETLN